MEAPYTDSLKVFRQTRKTVTIDTARVLVTVSIDRVKLAYILSDQEPAPTPIPFPKTSL